MPVDPSFLPALREELWMAKRVKGGGQLPDPARIAAIEEQIKLHEKAAKNKSQPDENASDVSTDYESHDADADDKQPERAERVAKARDANKPERAVAGDKEQKEKTDA